MKCVGWDRLYIAQKSPAGLSSSMVIFLQALHDKIDSSDCKSFFVPGYVLLNDWNTDSFLCIFSYLQRVITHQFTDNKIFSYKNKIDFNSADTLIED